MDRTPQAPADKLRDVIAPVRFRSSEVDKIDEARDRMGLSRNAFLRLAGLEKADTTLAA